MSRTALGAVAAGALVAGLVACQSIAGLGDFAPDDGNGAPSSGPSGGDGAGGAPSSSSGGGDPSTTGSTSTATTTTTTTTTSTGSGETCVSDNLLLAEIRTRGPDDGNQDFVEILNPTDRAIVLDDSWRLEVRGESAGSYAPRWTGDGSLTIGPGERVLLANSSQPNPLGGAEPDGEYGSGISDGASVVLYQADGVVDAVCFLCDEAQLAEGYVCEGTPLKRVAGCSAPGDRSVRRGTVAGVEGCADTGSNVADLEDREPSTPQGLGG